MVDADGGYDPGVVQYLGKIFFHGRGDGCGDGRPVRLVILHGPDRIDPVDIGRILEMFVIAVLILHIEDDVQTAQYARGETEDIDEAKGLALGEVSPGKFQIVLEHGGMVWGWRSQNDAICVLCCFLGYCDVIAPSCSSDFDTWGVRFVEIR